MYSTGPDVQPQHPPQPHPEAPSKALLPTPVTDFKRYRANAQQHGPLARDGHYPSRRNTVNLTQTQSSDGVLELPARYKRLDITLEEMEAIEVPPPFMHANRLERRRQLGIAVDERSSRFYPVL